MGCNHPLVMPQIYNTSDANVIVKQPDSLSGLARARRRVSKCGLTTPMPERDSLTILISSVLVTKIVTLSRISIDSV